MNNTSRMKILDTLREREREGGGREGERERVNRCSIKWIIMRGHYGNNNLNYCPYTARDYQWERY